MTQYLRVLRHKNFKYLFFGQAASTVGDRLVVVAIALFITRRTGSPTDLAVVLAAQSLPLIALLLFGGVWADRLPRHRIMVVTDAVRAVLHGTLAVLILSGAVAIWQLVVIEALFGAAQAFFQPAYTGLLPQTVPEDEIQDARALTETTFNVAFMVGPALATAVVLGIGAWEAFALDAATFVVSAALLLRIEPRARGDAAVPATLLEELRVGWREVRSRAWVWVTIAVFAGAVLCVFAPWYSLAPIIARDFYGGAGVFGVLESVGGLGAVIGALVAIRWRPEHPLRVGLMMVLVWPMMAAALALHRAAGRRHPVLVRHRVRVLADDDLVGDRARPLHPGARAVARKRVRLDGLAGAAPGRLRDRRSARRGDRAAASCSESAARSGSGCC